MKAAFANILGRQRIKGLDLPTLNEIRNTWKVAEARNRYFLLASKSRASASTGNPSILEKGQHTRMDGHTNGHSDTCAKHSDDSQSLTGKIALITGGSKGIGKGVAIALAHAGAQVVFTYLSDSSAAEALVTQIGIDKAVAIKSDASRMEDIEELIKETAWRFGRIDILIANAAVSPSKVSVFVLIPPEKSKIFMIFWEGNITHDSFEC